MPPAKPAYRLLNADQQADILRGQLLQAEADHFRNAQQLEAAADLPAGTVDTKAVDDQQKVLAVQIDKLGAKFDKLPKKTRDRLNPPAAEEPAA